MQQTYSSYVTLINIGYSYENRSLTLIKISVPSNVTKKAFWLDAGVHAREWIGISTVVFIAYSVSFSFFFSRIKFFYSLSNIFPAFITIQC